ncbi:hypothetical protein EV182_007365 [Spiromyces aspiralis]|uniref:Uncharacterized protein n=1 Tax=Spiromyces aspiralis TaxID=68401 RepID=A0ACC1HLI2_9FUNG|nr:hypothetical protein EV182_007365 [Spiromyces aspiralis]
MDTKRQQLLQYALTYQPNASSKDGSGNGPDKKSRHGGRGRAGSGSLDIESENLWTKESGRKGMNPFEKFESMTILHAGEEGFDPPSPRETDAKNSSNESRWTDGGVTMVEN